MGPTQPWAGGWMQDLIAILEAASGGSRELDREIAIKLGYQYQIGLGLTNYVTGVDAAALDLQKLYIARWTTSVDAALTLVPEGMCWDVWFDVRRPKGRVTVSISTPDYQYKDMPGRDGAETVLVKGTVWRATQKPTPALAICIAALKARA